MYRVDYVPPWSYTRHLLKDDEKHECSSLQRMLKSGERSLVVQAVELFCSNPHMLHNYLLYLGWFPSGDYYSARMIVNNKTYVYSFGQAWNKVTPALNGSYDSRPRHTVKGILYDLAFTESKIKQWFASCCLDEWASSSEKESVDKIFGEKFEPAKAYLTRIDNLNWRSRD